MRVRHGLVLAGLVLAVSGLLCAVGVPIPSGVGAAAPDDTVHLPVTVSQNGAPVKGLTQADFTIMEDGQARTVQAVASGTIPLSLAIIIDTSAMMRGPWMNDTFGAVRDLIAEGLASEDEACIYVFGRRPVVLQAWASRDTLLESRYKVPDGPAAAPLFETIARALRDSEKAKHRRRVLLVVSGGSTSDGWRRQAGPAFQEPAGRTTPPSPTNPTANPWEPSDEREKAMRALKQRDLAFYAISLNAPKPSDRLVEPMPPINTQELREVSESTGGYVELVTSTDALPGAVRRLREELQSQYLLSYVSPRGDDGKYHEVRVEVKNPEYKVRARSGYAAARSRR